AWAEFYVSPNADFSPPRYFLCESAIIPAIGIGGRFSLATLARTVSAGIPAGEYYVGIVIDRPNEVAEGNEANNTYWVTGSKVYINRAPASARRWQLYP
ncbi:MAG: hypothetical protein N3D11_13660, partial [Candidatus Sumerlaeia bacterium]|nr:hypothetical protein [Candidatus Sumerlaeia bacterium]